MIFTSDQLNQIVKLLLLSPCFWSYFVHSLKTIGGIFCPLVFHPTNCMLSSLIRITVPACWLTNETYVIVCLPPFLQQRIDEISNTLNATCTTFLSTVDEMLALCQAQPPGLRRHLGSAMDTTRSSTTPGSNTDSLTSMPQVDRKFLRQVDFSPSLSPSLSRWVYVPCLKQCVHKLSTIRTIIEVNKYYVVFITDILISPYWSSMSSIVLHKR